MTGGNILCIFTICSIYPTLPNFKRIGKQEDQNIEKIFLHHCKDKETTISFITAQILTNKFKMLKLTVFYFSLIYPILEIRPRLIIDIDFLGKLQGR